MKTVIIGGVAAGTKTAAKLKRENPAAEVVIYTKSQDISYAGCGLPYYIGGSIASREELIVNTPAKYTGLTGVPVHTGFEAVSVDPEAKTVSFANGETVGYDNLVIATGAEPVVPPVEGVTLPGVFKVRTPEDAITARQYIEENGVKKAVVVGGGFIGLEVAENLMEKGIAVTVLDMAPQLMPGVFDSEMADYIRRQLQSKGMRVMTGTALQGIQGGEKVTGVATAAGNLPADIVFLAVGIRPATKFLQGSGLQMDRGCILVNEYLETNLPHIYAVGDCAMVKNRVTGKPMWSAMGSTANIAGRALALGLGGEKAAYPGALGTAVVKLAADLNAAKTGLTEKAAAEAGYPVITATCAIDDKAHYYPGSSSFIIKMIADKETHKLLGLQIAGPGEVDKMADIAVVGISAGLKAEDFIMMDFAYAPPFSTAIHPFATACGVLCNKLSGRLESFTPAEYMAGAAKGYRIVDLLPAPTLTGFDWLDMTKPETAEGKFKKDEKLLLVCSRGKRAYLTQNKLRALGYTNTRVLEGGATVNVIKRALPSGGKLPAAEIKRLKGLGCLQDKRYDDVFNVRIITRNGKLTAEEGRIITEAAEKFGSGAFTMTTRLTIEIQGVRYENVEPLIAFLNEHGLETGGTGSLVRPVVSCKGTTCQYGLIDTFDLSEKIHERFYKGYHGVTLPHKFKIAVGGCPNNCVKPSLNDLGIVGQRLPMFDFSKCRGCKVCQVENACPIKVAKLQDGVLSVDTAACNSCGRCKGKCPFGVTEEYVNGCKVYIGGRWGKKVAYGRPLSKLFTSEEEVMDLIERAILFFRDEGITGERFSDTIDRLGFDYVEDKLLNGKIEKDSILEKKVTGGATC
ncbi:MAG TPA: FAD-dependent oxidoreductase [Candidatus Faecivivens stercoravium]|uniref:FAD-dependent oxidoreductase n=1 Tax=Candidatus Faecivivens stercoravium TaxID=2840803 RepID=A0A9D1DWF6_9FIRM|nr:FAD-dependent oxidoreductase [Candidatus Faecivivens stercoravium]